MVKTGKRRSGGAAREQGAGSMRRTTVKHRCASVARSLKKQAGVALLDALFAFMLLSIGILGIARVQAESIKQSGSAYAQTTADLLARQMFERMRLNPSGVSSGSYNAVSATVADPACITTSAGCTSATLADTDINNWYSNLSTSLPGGSGSISGAGIGSVFSVTVSWVDNSTSGSPTATWTVRGRL